MKHLISILVLSCLPVGFGFSLDFTVGGLTNVTTLHAVELTLEGSEEWLDFDLRPEVGLEVGLSRTVPQVLFPVGLLWESYLDSGWSWDLVAHALVGAALSDSNTELVWGGEAQVRVEFSWVPGAAVGLAAGARYTASSLAFPVHLFLEVPLGASDDIEPYEGEEDEHEGRE